jgi:hypothetical protein
LTGGNTVTITGSGFSHVVKVRFGAAVGARIDLGSTGRLTLVAPKHAAGKRRHPSPRVPATNRT